MTGVAPSRALDISLGTRVGVGAGVSVSLKRRRRRRRRRRQLEFDVHSRSFEVMSDKYTESEVERVEFHEGMAVSFSLSSSLSCSSSTDLSVGLGLGFKSGGREHKYFVGEGARAGCRSASVRALDFKL